MTVLFIGKRFYTNRDALRERFGRIWNLPWHWSRSGVRTRLWLIDYRGRSAVQESHGSLDVESIPVLGMALPRAWIRAKRRAASQVDVVVASGDCYVGLFGYKLARSLRARFVFDVYDKYDEFAGYVRLPGFDPFGFLLRQADATLFASQAMLSCSGRARGMKHLVPNGVDYEHFRPLGMTESREQLAIAPDSSCIGYFGSLTPDRGVEDLVAAAAALRSVGYQLNVVLAGKEEGVSVPDLPWVHYLGNLSYEEVPIAMASCDLLALPYRRSDYLDMASSCKIAEYIAMEKPLVATDTSNFRTNFPGQYAALSGLVAAPDDPKDLERVIRLQLTERRLVPQPERFSWANIASDLARELGLEAG